MTGLFNLALIVLGLWLLRRIWLFFNAARPGGDDTQSTHTTTEYAPHLKGEDIVEAEFEEIDTSRSGRNEE